MRSIYKYNVTTNDGVIEGPITKLLTAQIQHGTIVIWAEVDTTKPNRKFQIIPIGTGWPLDAPKGKDCVLDTHTYISTVQYMSGSLVFHVYAAEILPKAKQTETKNVNKNSNEPPKNSRINTEVLAHFLK
jgi:hypothetical protein